MLADIMEFVAAVQICSVKFEGCFTITDFIIMIIFMIAIYYYYYYYFMLIPEHCNNL
jgi:hypothetical protein